MEIIELFFDIRFWGGAIFAILLREITVWIPGQKDRRIAHLSRLIEQVWGPLTTIATRITQTIRNKNTVKEIIIPYIEFEPIIKATNELPHEFSRDDYFLLHEFIDSLEFSNNKLFTQNIDLATRFAQTVMSRWTAFWAEISVLREMRSSFFSRWGRTPKGEKLNRKAQELLIRGPRIPSFNIEELLTDIPIASIKQKETKKGFFQEIKDFFKKY